ncbi:MAG TPA: glutamate 5-kinase [Candidatus Omnitrophota bacterium]|nr:glutamate 5-kinase [Candidatus Omnitrophota bacterium]HPS20750.1 glutamate 5-kinase [Candidatus Omnitrophota bacterium]
MLKKKCIKRVTIKIGTKVLTESDNKIARNIMQMIVDQVAVLMDKGIEVVIVSSGAIGSALGLLNTNKKGKSLAELQALASIGQSYLMNMYNECFRSKGYLAGQILLTQEDFNHRKRYLNIGYSIKNLFKYKAVPIINENDAISTEEIQCGDNDRLSSLVASLTESDMLIILTDVDGLYDNEGVILKKVEEINDEIRSFCKGKGSEESKGGMQTKLEAARRAVCSGIKCAIVRGKRKDAIIDVVNGKDIGTVFETTGTRINARKRWIAFGIKSRGRVVVDQGAVKALSLGNKSLLPSGIIEVEGDFSKGDVVDITSESGKVIARGFSEYPADDVVKIKGLKTGQIEKVLGYKGSDEVVHRDNMAGME